MPKVKCPQCSKETDFSPENKSRPFCSERCKLIDLGQWANEDYKVPTEIHTPDLEGFDEDISSDLSDDEFFRQ